MPTATITCPRCSKTLTTTRAFTAGSRFRCPKCGAAFAARPEDVPPALTTPGVRPLPPPLDNAPRNVGAWALMLGAVGLGLLLLAGAGRPWPCTSCRNRRRRRSPSPLPTRATTAQLRRNGRWIQRMKQIPITPPEAAGRAARPAPAGPAPPDLPAALSVLSPEEQEKVNKAIDRGVEFLKKAQEDEGTWGRSHPVGMAALPGLTLLECGVPPDDPHVQKAADFVRQAVPRLEATYQLALAILFLDRLGDPQDEPLIRTMALRLLAGESPAGGWTYQCPLLSDKDERRLFTILETTRPRSSLELMTTQGGGAEPADLFTGRVADDPSGAAPGRRRPSAGPAAGREGAEGGQGDVRRPFQCAQEDAGPATTRAGGEDARMGRVGQLEHAVRHARPVGGGAARRADGASVRAWPSASR